MLTLQVNKLFLYSNFRLTTCNLVFSVFPCKKYDNGYAKKSVRGMISLVCKP